MRHTATAARIVVLAALAGSATAPSQTIPAPPPMFSPGYVEALRGILDLGQADVARLEQQLSANPEDFPARLRLMAYHQRADRAGRPEDRAERVRQTLWLVEHHPDSELLHSFVSQFSPDQLTAAEYQSALALWDAAARARPRDAAVQWNAASFFEPLDAGLHLHYLEATVSADPNHPFAIRPLAYAYARAIVQREPQAAHALAALEDSNNVWVLGNAAYTIQSLYNQSLQRGAADPRDAALAERYFLRAQALDPNLDRQAILPQIDLAAVAAARATAEQAARERQAQVEDDVARIERLPVESFTELPAAVAGVLRARGCTIPQPAPREGRRNVIRGQFFAAGETGWAVLCSVDGSSVLLAFRSDRDTSPQAIVTRADRNYLQDLGRGRYDYSREITAVGGDFILRHYRGAGGPEPPPIDHQGIDDAFLGKASSIWYFYQGNWRSLPGAD